MNTLQTLTGILGLSFVSGVNLYATILTVGLGIHFGWIHGLPNDLNILANPIVLTVAGIFYAAEFIADKVPFFTPIWDAVHTVIRPLGAAALALGAASDMNPLMKILAMIIGGSVALSTHSTKMGYRLLAHASPEPVSDSIFSMAEDAGVVGLVLLVYKHPETALVVIIGLLIVMVIVLYYAARMLRALFQRISGRVASWFAV